MKTFITHFILYFCLFSVKAQDIIRKTDGTEIKTKVLEVNPGDIKYKKYGFADGPTYTILLKDISKITYSNGEVETFGKVVENKKPVLVENKTPAVKTETNPIQQTVVSGFINKSEAKNVTDANGLRQGKWMVYLRYKESIYVWAFPKLIEMPNKVNAQYYRLVIYKDGNFSGMERLYSLSGELQLETFYENGKTEENKFSENGKLQSTIPRQNGNINGLYKYYNENGNLFQEHTYVDGERIGLQKDYDIRHGYLVKSEVLEAKPKEVELPDSIVGDLENGLVKVFSPKGFLKNEIPYKNGKINGTSKTYNEQGVLILEETFNDNKKEGISKKYYENGQIYSETAYENDKLNGDLKRYDENGKLSIEIPYINNIANGVMKQYQNGIISQESTMENGNLNGFSKTYRKGQLSSEMNYKDNKSNGYWKSYTNGQVTSETLYENGQIIGVAKTYSENGILTSETPYQNGKRNGVAKRYDSETGELTFETPYLDDVVHGVEKFYYKGEVSSQTFYSYGSIDKKAQRKENLNSFVKDAKEDLGVLAVGAVQFAQTDIASQQYAKNPNATNLNNYTSVIKNNLTLNPKDAIIANSNVLTNASNATSSLTSNLNNQAESAAVTANTSSGKDGNSAEAIACAKEAQREYENSQEYRNVNNNKNNSTAPMQYYGELAKAKNAEILLNHCGQYLSNQEKEALNAMVIDSRKMANDLKNNNVRFDQK